MGPRYLLFGAVMRQTVSLTTTASIKQRCEIVFAPRDAQCACTTGRSRMRAMHKLPVVPICRRTTGSDLQNQFLTSS